MSPVPILITKKLLKSSHKIYIISPSIKQIWLYQARKICKYI